MMFAFIVRDNVIKLAQEPLKLVLQKQTYDQKVHLKSNPLYECLSNITLSSVSWIQIQATREHQNIFFWVASKCKINEYVDFKLMFLAKLSRINWGKYGIKWSRLSALRPMLCGPRQAPGLRE